MHWLLFTPLLGFLWVILNLNTIQIRTAQMVTCTTVTISLLATLWCAFFYPANQVLILYNWINFNALQVEIGLLLDSISLTMAIMVNLVSAIVHVYSIGYMQSDPSIPRFMAYLNFFTFAMLLLITAPNLWQMFLGWEGVGLASYLLIGFWFEKKTAATAGVKAFLFNRIGDAGLIIAFIAIFLNCDSLSINTITSSNTILPIGVNNLICGMLLLGVMSKSAQFGLHNWLPDAMEGPTPVSALIHAATMVTAGIFLLVRFANLFEQAPLIREIMTYLGLLTAIFGASTAIAQVDVKRIIAYSTCSQLGLMVMACGCGAYQIAFFHLITHAFFKALLFLGAGSVIHAMSGEQNIFKMGGIWRNIPVTYVLMWIGSLAIAGVPFFAGYYSKELIINTAYAAHKNYGFFLYGGTALVTILTAFYSWRLLLVVFHGKSMVEDRVLAHLHESKLVMLIPMVILAIFAIFGGFIGDKFLLESFWQGKYGILLKDLPHMPWILENLPVFLTATGITLTLLIYLKIPKEQPSPNNLVRNFFFNKWYIDSLYQWILLKPIVYIANFLWRKVDLLLIDNLVPNGAATLAVKYSHALRKIQNGKVNDYVLLIALIVAVVLGYLIWVRNFFYKV